jgi:hypothetical protein
MRQALATAQGASGRRHGDVPSRKHRVNLGEALTLSSDYEEAAPDSAGASSCSAPRSGPGTPKSRTTLTRAGGRDGGDPGNIRQGRAADPAGAAHSPKGVLASFIPPSRRASPTSASNAGDREDYKQAEVVSPASRWRCSASCSWVQRIHCGRGAEQPGLGADELSRPAEAEPLLSGRGAGDESGQLISMIHYGAGRRASTTWHTRARCWGITVERRMPTARPWR